MTIHLRVCNSNVMSQVLVLNEFPHIILRQKLAYWDTLTDAVDRFSIFFFNILLMVKFNKFPLIGVAVKKSTLVCLSNGS